MSEKKRSVGLVVLTDVPGLGLCFVAQRRGTWDFEKDKPESWPGALQVTVHGKLEENESFKEGLIRETQEELGKFYDIVHSWEVVETPLTLKFVLLHEAICDKQEIVTYGLMIPCFFYFFLRRIRLHPSSGGLQFITEKQVDEIQDLTQFPRDLPVTELAMFPDEIEAVKIAFVKLA